MARKSLRPQLNQIRAWVRQGRTDAWIAHQLEVTTAQLSDFRRRHDLTAEGEDAGGAEVDLRDEIEAEIEAAEEADTKKPEEKADEGDEKDEEKDDKDGKPRRRRRRRRGGRGRRRRPGAGMDATLEKDRNGFTLKLDKKLKDDPIYSENWEGHKDLKLTVEPDRIVLRRVEEEKEADSKEADSKGDSKDD